MIEFKSVPFHDDSSLYFSWVGGALNDVEDRFVSLLRKCGEKLYPTFFSCNHRSLMQISHDDMSAFPRFAVQYSVETYLLALEVVFSALSEEDRLGFESIKEAIIEILFQKKEGENA